MSLSFIPTSITIKVMQNDQVSEISEIKVDAVVAEQTGLAYIIHPAESEGDEPHITLTHLASKTLCGRTWGATSEQEARGWISLLHEALDWTERIPRIRPGKMAMVLDLAAIGALHEFAEENAQ